MHRTGNHRRVSIWLAIWALLFAALAPTLSHAVRAATPDAGWVEVCTVAGSKWVQLSQSADDAGAPDSDPGLHALEHCPACSAYTPAPGLPPSDYATLLQLSLGDALPSLFLQAPHTLFAWASAQPRGPPSQS